MCFAAATATAEAPPSTTRNSHKRAKMFSIYLLGTHKGISAVVPFLWLAKEPKWMDGYYRHHPPPNSAHPHSPSLLPLWYPQQCNEDRGDRWDGRNEDLIIATKATHLTQPLPFKLICLTTSAANYPSIHPEPNRARLVFSKVILVVHALHVF